jgi:hypothetical protein
MIFQGSNHSYSNVFYKNLSLAEIKEIYQQMTTYHNYFHEPLIYSRLYKYSNSLPYTIREVTILIQIGSIKIYPWQKLKSTTFLGTLLITKEDLKDQPRNFLKKDSSRWKKIESCNFSKLNLSTNDNLSQLLP